MDKMTPDRKIAALRAEIEKASVDGFIVPHTDEYLSEYLPACAERLAWLTGFTGSSGYAVILKDRAVVMTHGIYTIQIRREVDQSVYMIDDFTVTPIGQWIAANAPKGSVIGYDPRLHTRAQIEQFSAQVSQNEIALTPVTSNPIDAIWHDRPAPPQGRVTIFPDAVAGASSLEKRRKIAGKMREESLSSVVITRADSVCWLLNVRGSDIPYNPLVLSNLILHASGEVDWYVSAAKITPEIRNSLGADIRIHPEEAFEPALAHLSGTVQVDPDRSPLAAETILKRNGIKTYDGKDPCVMPRACKTLPEQKAMKQAHVRDGIAVTKFLHWLDCQDFEKTHHTELSLVAKLEEFRKGIDSYMGPSFETISGWADNGAVIHYRVSPETDKKITTGSFYLVDSGGQYEWGTTDITRTIAIGTVGAEEKNAYTRVMKGHIAVASARMDGIFDGAELDKRARRFLQEDGKDYAHGTGHGVGCFLAVHEEATYVAPKSVGITFRPGMIISNEPGYYLEDRFGIRLENLMLCQEDEADDSLYWETITLAPFDLRPIDWSLMTPEETAWLKDYHSRVFDTLSPFMTSEELDWLREVCFSYFE